MSLLDKLRGRRKQRATDNETTYWQLVQQVADGKDGGSPADADKILHTAGRSIDDLEAHAALVRERGVLETTTAPVDQLAATLKHCAQDVGAHEAARKTMLAAWEKEHATLMAKRRQAKVAADGARKAVSRIAAIDREIAEAKGGHARRDARPDSSTVVGLRAERMAAERLLDLVDEQAAVLEARLAEQRCNDGPDKRKIAEQQQALESLRRKREGLAATASVLGQQLREEQARG